MHFLFCFTERFIQARGSVFQDKKSFFVQPEM